MGLDGGTIPTRGELVRMKEKPEQKDATADRIHKWNNCTISQLPLHEPIVTCHMGMLYNKQSALELLLGKTAMTSDATFAHVESVKDIRELRLTDNPLKADSCANYICPVTGLEMNGKHRFFCNWHCGCVTSERGINQVKSSTCLSCGMEYDKRDLVILNPTDDDLHIQKDRMAYRKSKKYPPITTNNLSDAGGDAIGSVAPSEGTSEINPESSTTRPAKRSLHSEVEVKPHKHKKSKKEKKKHKKEKHKGKSTTRDSDKPKLHPGWSKYLSGL